MMVKRLRILLGPALLSLVGAGCDTAQPGGGFTNGPPPVEAPEKPAVRTDEPPPDRPDPATQGGAGGALPNPNSDAGGTKAPAVSNPATAVPATPPAQGDSKSGGAKG